MYRYEIWTAELSVTNNQSSVQQGLRPVIIVSNDAGNRSSTIVTVVPLTSRKKKHLPIHVCIRGQGLRRTSVALCEQVTTIDKFRLRNRIGCVTDPDDRAAICRALSIQMGLAA